MAARPVNTPSSGERRAVIGYHGQYRAAATVLLQLLREGALQWVRVADPQAGRVDDLVVGMQARVDGFQIKWSQYSAPFSFNDLVSASENKPSIIAQLADGWKRLRQSNTGQRVVVHLVTNNSPSTGDRLPASRLVPRPGHFAAFLEQAWKPIRREALAIPPEWQTAWDILRRESGLPEDEFELFTKDCELELSFQIPQITDAASPEERIFQEDLSHLAQFLFDIIADPARIIELRHEVLLSRLGWKPRLEFRNRHEFPEPEIPYYPVETTVKNLKSAIESLPGGYISLLGSPGSGKSTLLTQTLRILNDRIIRYYAYVPDAQDPSRGESVWFLHDLVLAIERAGFRVGESLSKPDRDQLRPRFLKQLELLHTDWQQNQRKTVILIDGLDHIARELHPDRSLLLDLPLPDQIPDGVYLIFGTQTDQLADLPSAIQHAIQQPERRIAMQLLTRQAVFRIVEQARLPFPPSVEQKERVFILSEGHPLALDYLIKRLNGIHVVDGTDVVLNDSERFTGKIEEQYHSYWRKTVENNDGLARLLGQLARMRGFIDLKWVETWVPRDIMDP